MSQILLRTGHRLTSARALTSQITSSYHNRAKVGNRDVVGFGVNGEAAYADLTAFPMPAIRFRENTSDVLALREKEKGDWKKLTMEEKKALYRASFCQTYSEMKAPTGEWKITLTAIFTVGGLALWFYVWLRKYVYGELPESFSEESQKAQLKRMIDLRVNPIEGLASKWDYEKGKWKD